MVNERKFNRKVKGCKLGLKKKANLYHKLLFVFVVKIKSADMGNKVDPVTVNT